MKSGWVGVVLVLGLLILPVAAMAETPSYLALKLGAYFPSSKSLGVDRAPGESGDFKTGFNGELAGGYKFMPNLAAELGVGFLQTKADITDATGTTSVKGSVIPVNVSAKGILPINPSVELYGLAGLGAYFAKIKGGDVSKSKTVIGFQLGVGGNYNITPVVFVGAEVKYIFAKPKFDVDGQEVKAKFDGTIVTADVGYRF